MREKRHGWDRRSEARFSAAERITWARPGGADASPGWMSDTSRSSLSFIAAARNQPSFGEEVELRGANASPQRYRVTRVAPYDEHLALIGCRQIDARSTPEEWADAG